MTDQTTLIRVLNVWELFIFKEPICVLLVVLEMIHAFLDLGGRLRDRLAHFLTNEPSIVRLVFLKD